MSVPYPFCSSTWTTLKASMTPAARTGDRVLKSVSRILRRNLRRQDNAGRWGGEEFLIVQPETNLRGAALSAERIRNEIEKIIAPALRIERKCHRQRRPWRHLQQVKIRRKRFCAGQTPP